MTIAAQSGVAWEDREAEGDYTGYMKLYSEVPGIR